MARIASGGTLCAFAAGAFVAGGVAPAATPPPPAFNQCRMCHPAAPGLAATVGPNLFGVAGAAAGARPGYDYSTAIKNSGITWTSENLDTFIAAPRRIVRGTKMTYAGERDPGKRAAIVRYLETLR